MSAKDQLTPTIKPGDDFYNYVNKHWLDGHPIPPDKARFSAMDVLTDENLAKLRGLLEADVSSEEPRTIRLVKQFYQAAMNEAAIESMTPDFIQSILAEIRALPDTAAIASYPIKQRGLGEGFLWGTIIEPDDKNSKHYLARFWQGGLGLPERTYYLDDGQKFVDIRRKYRSYLADFFKLAGLDQVEQRAENVYNIEYALAEASMTAVDCRDPQRTYNLFSPKELASSYPTINWADYLPAVGLGASNHINVAQPDFLTAVSRLLHEQPIEHWQDYLTIHMLTWMAAKLAKPYEEIVFNFYGKILSGREEMEPRHTRITRMCMSILPEPTGRLFVEHFFDGSAKAGISDLVDHLQVSLGNRIQGLKWMTNETKGQALHKLSTFLPLLGYPDNWKIYDGLEFGPSYANNFLAAWQFEWKFQVGRINGPVDREEWLMSPALVNAYYWPNSNGITFPAGILQPPFFDSGGDFAANYGAVGAVIGHELTHGFDDQGSQFDADGNMKTWWQETDRTDFDSRTKKLAKQYDSYEIAGRHLDGKLTLGENIADLGGLLVAFDALQDKLADLGKRDKIDGLTPEQRFFISYAATWRGHTRSEMLLNQIVTDPHSPNIFRVNGVVPNMDAFYDAFDIKPSDSLYIAPEKRVRIW